MHSNVPAGMFVLSPSTGASKARAQMFPFFRCGKMTTERFQVINKKFSLLSRVVVAPEYRGVGLAVYLAKAARILSDTPYVECVAAMAEFSSFLTGAGFVCVGRTDFMKDSVRDVDQGRGVKGKNMGSGNVKITSGARYFVATGGDNLRENLAVL